MHVVNELLLIILALGLAGINTLWIFLLWRGQRKMTSSMSHINAVAQRLDREMGQHRYALALMRQLLKDMPPQEEDPKLDQELLDNAVTFLDEFIKPADAVEPVAEVVATPEAGQKNLPEKAIDNDKLTDNDILQFIKKAVTSNTIAICEQPIVTLPGRQSRYHEIFSRILVGSGYIPAQKFITVAKNNNMIGAVDNLLLLRCLQILKDRATTEQNAEFFINISAKTLGNKNYIKNLVDFLAANPKLSSRLIFEMTQADSMTITANARNVIEGLALLGCRFSMDQITIFGMDNTRLLDQHISFVKLDAGALEREMGDSSGRKRIKKIKNMLDAQGVNVIIEKVENEKQLFGLLDLHADFGQGYLFGKPTLLQ